VWEDSKSCCSTDLLVDGKKAGRIPGYQVRITPMYTFSLSDAAHLDLFTTFTAIGKRFGDLQNLQPLPAYDTVSAGFILNIHSLAFQLTGDNLTNSHGLTEGNPRSLGSVTGALPQPKGYRTVELLHVRCYWRWQLPPCRLHHFGGGDGDQDDFYGACRTDQSSPSALSRRGRRREAQDTDDWP
jgi:hypothetical protein